MKFDKIINRKNTYCTQWDYIEDRFEERELLPFTISDMDFACPKEIIKTISDRNKHPIYGYSRWKNKEYLESIIAWYKRRFECEVEKEDIMYSPSVMYSISKLICLLSNEGEAVCMCTPAYDAFFKVIENNNRIARYSKLKECGGEYTLDFNSLEREIKNSRIFLLCNPHNPVGRVWSEEELRKIIELCERYDVSIISDDIHMDIDYSRKMIPLIKLRSKCTIAICTSPSKTFNIPSLGGSYILSKNKNLIYRFEMLTRYTDFVNSPSILNVLATITAYNECEKWVDDLNSYLYENLIFTNQYIKQNIPKLKYTIAEGCYFAWIDFSSLGISDEDMQRKLIRIGKVGIMSGVTYGEKNKLRFHVGCPREKVIDGLTRLKQVVEEIEGEKV